jgi:hypothetical protein
MEDQQIQKIIAAVEVSIHKTVNGKIDGLTAQVADLSVRFDSHKEEMDPIIEGWKTVRSGRSFIIWIGAPLAVIGGIMALFK